MRSRPASPGPRGAPPRRRRWLRSAGPGQRTPPERLTAELRAAHETAVAGAHAAEVEAAAAEAARAGYAEVLAQAEAAQREVAGRLADRLSGLGFAAEAEWQAARRETAVIERLDALVAGHAEAKLL